jgi:hypothetical protein
MSEKNTASVDDLVWAREMLRSFSRIEKDLRKEIGNLGIEKVILKSPLVIALIIFSVIVASLGFFLWHEERDALYLTGCGFPFFAVFYILKMIKEEKQKNIFRFIGKSTSLSIPMLENLLNIVEQGIFEEKERFETIIAWRIHHFKTTDEKKFAYVFEGKTWENIETAQKQCLVLAILMTSLQRFLYNNRDVYNEHVKKIPLMNAGYNYKPGKQQPKKLNAEDIQTFGFTENSK